MIVVDASVLVLALGDDGEHGDLARNRLHGELLMAPALIDIEVISAWRRVNRSGELTDERAQQALNALVSLPITRSRHWPHMERIWELRDNVTPYDAAYVSLAEVFDIPLLTADEPLTKAPGPRCKVELLR